jgi:hypothetical protein
MYTSKVGLEKRMFQPNKQTGKEHSMRRSVFWFDRHFIGITLVSRNGGQSRTDSIAKYSVSAV